METSKAPNKINFLHALSESLLLTSGLKWAVFKRLVLTLFLVLIFIFLSVVAAGSKLITTAGPHSSKVSFHVFSLLFGLIFCYMAAKIWVPAIMMGVRRAIGLPTDLKIIQAECAKVQNNLFNLIILYVVILNLVLFVSRLIIDPDVMGLVFGVVIAIACMYLFIPINIFAIPLLIIRKLPVKAALDSAYKMMGRYWKQVLASYLILGIVPAILAVLQFILFKQTGLKAMLFMLVVELIVYFWLLPWEIALGGVFFRDAYGLKKIPPIPARPEGQESITPDV